MSLINSLKLWIGHRTFDSYGVINVFKGIVEKKRHYIIYDIIHWAIRTDFH